MNMNPVNVRLVRVLYLYSYCFFVQIGPGLFYKQRHAEEGEKDVKVEG